MRISASLSRLRGQPKCGFLPLPKFIKRENMVKTRVTRFKMHQALKLHEGKISWLSEYDPLDLFSGSRDRVSQAIRALFHCPQNNFRVFFNGSLVFGALGGGMDKSVASDFSCEKNEAFQAMLKAVIHDVHSRRVQSFLELIGETMFHSGIIDRLLKVQKLDIFDIEGAIHAYYNVISQPCLVCQKLNDPDLLKRCSSIHSLSLEESLKILRGYLISTTAKDCSIMVSFRPRPRDLTTDFGSVLLKMTGQIFDYKAYFIDLDMKPLRKMPYYYELDQKILEFFADTGSTLIDGIGSTCPFEAHSYNSLSLSEYVGNGV